MHRLRPASVRHLQVFCLAARHSSFKQAAAALYLTPSAVSHRIRELEASLGVALFERRPRAVELTDAGRTLYAEAMPLLDALEEALARTTQRLQRERLRVTAPQFFASEILIPRLAGFANRWPQIDLRLDTTLPRPSEHAAEADASILLATGRPEGVRAIALGELRVTATCSPGYRGALGPLGARLPAEAVLLTHRSWPEGWRRWTEATGIRIARQPQTLEFDTMFSLLRAAEHGLGIALAPSHLVESWLQGGALTRLDGKDVPLGDTYWFAARPADLKRPAVRAFRDWVLTEFSAR